MVVDLKRVTDDSLIRKFGVESGCALLEYDFVLVTEEAAMDLRHKNASVAMSAQEYAVH